MKQNSNGEVPVSREDDEASVKSYARIATFKVPIPAVSNDPVAKKKRIGMFHSIVMGFCLLILLMTILVTQEPYRYTKNNLSLQKGVHLSELQEDTDLTIDDIWDWIDQLSDEIGGETYNEILLNCGYSSYKSQTVTIDGTQVDIVDPSKYESACSPSDMGFIRGFDDPLYLIGNHQILAVGVFTNRATTRFPIEKSVASTEETLEVNTDKAAPLNPLKDNKVIEVCSIYVVDDTDSPTSSPGNSPPPPSSGSSNNSPTSSPPPPSSGSSSPTLNPTKPPPPAAAGAGTSAPTPSPTKPPPPPTPSPTETTSSPTKPTPSSPSPTSSPIKPPPSSSSPTSSPTKPPPPPTPSPTETTSSPTKPTPSSSSPTSSPIKPPPSSSSPTSSPTKPPPPPTPSPTNSPPPPTPLPTKPPPPPTPSPTLPHPPPRVGQRRRLQEEDDYTPPGVRHTCVFKDGFAVSGAPYTPGSTLNWEGEIITVSEDEEYYAYDDRVAYFFEDSSKQFVNYSPCFKIDNGTAVKGISDYTGSLADYKAALTECGNTWISKGREFRTQCLDQQTTGATATEQQSYLAGLYSTNTVSEMYEAFFGCESIYTYDAAQIDDVFIEARRPIDSYLAYDQSYGAFFPTESESMWVKDAILGKKTLKMHGFIDKQTTTATVYLITRNLDEDALFYSLTKVAFNFRVSGYTNVLYQTIFSPMIQYNYGTEGYPWRNRTMYVWEILFLIIFSLFALRELYQLLFSRIIPCCKKIGTKNANISPVLPTTEDAKSSSSGNKEDADDEYKVRYEDSSAKDIEEEKPKKSPIFDLNHDGKDDFEQLESFMHDLEDNAEEFVDMVDEFLPDAAGLLDIMDWLTIAIVAVTIYFRVDYIDKAAELHTFFKSLAEEREYQDHMTDIINDFEAISQNTTTMNTLVMTLVFVGMFQFFRYLSFDRRLNIVTATIKESLGSLLPVLIIFLVVMFAYAVLGTVMYGAQLDDWSNVGKSIAQLFLLILGEFGAYFDIMQINPILSAVFFWSYIIMALFLLFNMVLAVIFTVYDAKTTEISELEEKEKEKEKERKKNE